MIDQFDQISSYIELLKEKGYFRFWWGDKIIRFQDDKIDIDFKVHQNKILVVIDRVKISQENQSILKEAFEKAYQIGNNIVVIQRNTHNKWLYFSKNYSCIDHNIFLNYKLIPRFFSFNHHLGACLTCEGIGRSIGIDENKMIVNQSKPLFLGALNEEFFKILVKYFPNIIEDFKTQTNHLKIKDINKIEFSSLNFEQRIFYLLRRF